MKRNAKNCKASTIPVNLPFLFTNKPLEEDDCSTSSSYNVNNTDTFLKELNRIGMPTLNLLPYNPIKKTQNKLSTPTSPVGRFPYQRKSRSISPPKDLLTVCERKSHFVFNSRSPVVPDNSLQGNLPCEEINEEDNDLLMLKQQYLSLVQQAPGLNFKSELFDIADELSGTEEFDEWETSIIKKMQLH